MENKQEKAFNDLISKVKNCNLCPRMCGRTKVLSEENGNISSKVMFIAEAPGKHGADCTGVPLTRDKTGKNFEELLKGIRWKREDIFITNTVLCNPQKINKNGKLINDKPTIGEIKKCNDYLKRTIEIVNPSVIVTLGEIALNALKHICCHNLVLGDCVTEEQDWNGKKLFPLYHPSPTVINCTRNLETQKKDFAALSCLVDPIKGIKNKLVG